MIESVTMKRYLTKLMQGKFFDTSKKNRCQGCPKRLKENCSVRDIDVCVEKHTRYMMNNFILYTETGK